MQNAGQYVPGAANAHPPQQFVPSEPSPTGGSTTSSLRQFRKRDVDKSQLEQPPKQESHVARVAPHNHYPPVSNDHYRYPSHHQFSEYSPQVKYSEIADASQPNPISTSVIQKPKSKEYMEMCNVQQQHINSQQQYSPENGQYLHRDPTQGYPASFKPEAQYLSKEQHQYQQLVHHPTQPKYNAMMTQNVRKYNPGPADNPFLNKLSKMHPSMARSIISDHHLQDPQPSYSPLDQRAMYGQQNHRFYPAGSHHQPNPYVPNPNYSMNNPHHYSNYPSASCSYSRTPTVTPRYAHMERSVSPARRGYPENVHMNHIPYHNMPQRMQSTNNYPTQFAGGPEYAQHYQHRRMGPECYPQPCRPTQYIQNHLHQMQAQEMQELPESRISPSDDIKKFIENWAADEEPSTEMNPMESNLTLRDNIKVRDDAPPGTVYMINATDVQYFENNGSIPIVASESGGIQLTPENYQYLLKNGLVDNTGMVRIIEANKEISVDSNGNRERVVNLQIMEPPKPDCMMATKNFRPNDGALCSNGMLPKAEDDSRRVVIHQNTLLSSGNNLLSGKSSSQQPSHQSSLHEVAVESISITKELVDKNCSPINLDQLENNLGLNEPDPETENKKSNSISPIPTNFNSTDKDVLSDVRPEEADSPDEADKHSDDSQGKSPESKSMPIIDLFGVTHTNENDAVNDTQITQMVDRNDCTEKQNSTPDELNTQSEVLEEENIPEQEEIILNTNKSCQENNKPRSADSPLDLPQDSKKTHDSYKSDLEGSSMSSSVIVSPDDKKKEIFSKIDDVVSSKEDKFKETTNDAGYSQSPISSITPRQLESDINKSVSKTDIEATEPIATNLNNDTNAKTSIVTSPSIEISSPSVERIKKTFSVDDIIHHIGNNIKRGSRDFEAFASVETTVTFIENEIVFSSLEQILQSEHRNRIHTFIKQDEEKDRCTVVRENVLIESTNNTDESVNQNATEKYTEDPTRVVVREFEIEHMEIGDRIIVDNEIREQVRQNDEKEAMEPENSSEPISSELLEPEDHTSSTNNDMPYRNAIRVDESSVLLQIAGETIEINVNVVNGKKVITVVPFSESTVVDYNDNYEVSPTISTNKSMIIGESKIVQEKMEVVEATEEEMCEASPMICQNDEEEQQRELSLIIGETLTLEKSEFEVDKEEQIKEAIPKTSEATVALIVPNEVPAQENQNVICCSELNEAIDINDVDSDSKNVVGDIILELTLEENSDEYNAPTEKSNICDTDLEKSENNDSRNLDISNHESRELEVELNDDSKLTGSTKIVKLSGTDDTIEPSEFVNKCDEAESLKTSEIADIIESDKNSTTEEPHQKGTFNCEPTTGNDQIDEVPETITINAVDTLLQSHTSEDISESKNPEKIPLNDSKDICALVQNTLESSTEVPSIDEIQYNKTETELLDYELEDDVFILEEPPHEIIVTDPLEGVGLIEEVDKTTDSYDILLEPVTTSEEATVSPFTHGDDLTTISLKETDSKETKESPPSTATEKSADSCETDYQVENVEELETTVPNQNKELIVKLNKPEIQILSPTSTNIEDSIASLKDNIYLEPRKKINSDNDVSETNSLVVATKAAKKLYESDLQIPAITTSGDISPKSSRKPVKYQHDTVSSSKKDRTPKDNVRNKKYHLKRSKRINEKATIKTEQKELLKLLVERRKHRKKLKEEERKESIDNKSRELLKDKSSSEVLEIKENSPKSSTENDDEYADFRELLRARKLKKLKKLQELNERKIKEMNLGTENIITVKNDVKIENTVADMLLIKTSNDQSQAKHTDTKRKCCIGCHTEPRKNNVRIDKNQKERKHKKSSEDKSKKIDKHRNNEGGNTAYPVEFVDVKTSLASSAPLASNPVPLNREACKFDDNSNRFNKTLRDIKTSQNLPLEPKTKVSENHKAPITVDLSTKDSPIKRFSFCDDISSSSLNNNSSSGSEELSKSLFNIRAHSKDPRKSSQSYANQVMVPSVSELMEENSGPVSKKKISLADYVNRKRKTSADNDVKTKLENKETKVKKLKLDSAPVRRNPEEEFSSSLTSEDESRTLKRTLKDVKTSFVIHSSDWEDSESPISTNTQSNEDCLIRDFSGLIESKSKRPVIDVSELIPVETLENPKDKKLQEYKDKVDSQLSSLNIQIPKIKPQNGREKSNILIDPCDSPESSRLIKKFLSSEKITQSEMEKIKKIISYKRLIQHKKNAVSPTKSPGSASTSSSQSIACSSYEPTCLTGKSPDISESINNGSHSDPSDETKQNNGAETDSAESSLHHKKLNAKRKLHPGYESEGSSSVTVNEDEKWPKKDVDYSVINRLGKDGLPKIIFKRKPQNTFSSNSHLLVELERIDHNIRKIEKEYNVTVTQLM